MSWLCNAKLFAHINWLDKVHKINFFCEQYFFWCFWDHLSDQRLLNLSMAIKHTHYTYLFLVILFLSSHHHWSQSSDAFTLFYKYALAHVNIYACLCIHMCVYIIKSHFKNQTILNKLIAGKGAMGISTRQQNYRKQTVSFVLWYLLAG